MDGANRENETDRSMTMNGPKFTNRRTVLKAMTATAIGGSLASGAATATRASPPGEANGRRNVVEITARDDHEAGEHLFELSAHEVASGWTTFEFDNRTEHTHFVYSSKAPQQAIEDAASEGMALLDFWIETVTKPFQFLMDGVYVPDKDPDPDDNTDIYDSLFPPWFGDVTFHGGPGLTSGSRSSTSTVTLAPGEYIVECYVKDDNNDFHSYLGMLDQLSVTDDAANANEPESTLGLTLTNSGVDVDGSVRPGKHIVAVNFEEQQLYGNLVGHDIHLIRFDDETDVNDVNNWMNYIDPTQLIADGTEPGTFMGGVKDIWTANLPETGYFHVNLKPGDYAWVAEVPDPKAKGFLTEFTVPSGRGVGGR